MQVLERFTERLIKRQRAMYAAGTPFREKWRTAMDYLEQDLAAGYPKIWYELQAMAWNRPEFCKRVAHVHAEWNAVLTEAIGRALREYGINKKRFPVEAMTALVITLNEGMMFERLSGIDTGHKALLAMIDGWLGALEEDRLG